MTAETPSIGALIKLAQEGDRRALNQLMAACRSFIKIHAQREMSAALKRQVDPSDVVQVTLLDVYRGFHTFRGNSEQQFEAWLRVILRRNVFDIHGSLESGIFSKLQIDPGGSDSPDWFEAVADDSSASRRAMRGEAAICLAQALERLPESQREAVRLRHLEGWPLAKIATKLGRSQQATAGLIKRGIKALRKILVKEP